MIGQDAITGWRNVVPWRNDLQVEQDLILHAMIHAIYSDPILSEKLALRGGTCLNKLIWNTPARYSEDLDLVQISAEKAGPTISRFRKVLEDIFDESAQWETTRGSFRLYYSFAPEGRTGERQRINVEINIQEHFAVEGYRKKRLILNSLWRRGETDVTTFSAEELFATKLRALYQRRKGRDLFDLWKSFELGLNNEKVIDIFLRYMKHAGKQIYRDHFAKNLEEKLKDRNFMGDIVPLIIPGTDYDILQAADLVDKKIFSLIPQSKKKARHLRSK